MATFDRQILIDAPASAVWAVLSDIGTIADWNTGLKGSQLLGDQPGGLGARRHCDLGGKRYLDEEVVAWEPNRGLTMRITDTSLPFETADIRFDLAERDGTTLVTVVPTYQLKFGSMGRFMDRLFVRRRYQHGMDALLTGLKAHVEAARRHAGPAATGSGATA